MDEGRGYGGKVDAPGIGQGYSLDTMDDAVLQVNN